MNNISDLPIPASRRVASGFNELPSSPPSVSSSSSNGKRIQEIKKMNCDIFPGLNYKNRITAIEQLELTCRITHSYRSIEVWPLAWKNSSWKICCDIEVVWWVRMTKDIEENVFQSVLASKEPPLQPLAARKLGRKEKAKEPGHWMRQENKLRIKNWWNLFLLPPSAVNKWAHCSF